MATLLRSHQKVNSHTSRKKGVTMIELKIIATQAKAEYNLNINKFKDCQFGSEITINFDHTNRVSYQSRTQNHCFSSPINNDGLYWLH